MPILQTQQDFRPLQRLTFCYLCGDGFRGDETTNRDHLPPSALFHPSDRDPPLVLPTHTACNSGWSEEDEFLGYFMGTIEGWPLPRSPRKLNVAKYTYGSSVFAVSKGLHIHKFIIRCVRGFHAALYGEWLPNQTDNSIHPPLHGVAFDGNTMKPADRMQEALLEDKVLEQHAFLVQILKKNRIAKCTDKVISRNGRCIFECVWGRHFEDRWTCTFGLKINNWHRFGELAGHAPRGCVGIYSPANGKPTNSTCETELQYSFSNVDKLNAFGD